MMENSEIHRKHSEMDVINLIAEFSVTAMCFRLLHQLSVAEISDTFCQSAVRPLS
jgi:hypothetical protein